MRLRVPVDPARDHIEGRPDAPLQLVEYGDFQCPACGAAYYQLREVERRMAGHLLFVYRHLPLAEIHPQAVPAAETSEAASAQGQFWPMHHMLFENQDRLDRVHLLQYARKLALDVDAVANALDTHRFLPRIREDFIGGARSGVNGTPTMFINGVRMDGPWNAESLIVGLETALKRSGELRVS
jgi:protein-disulfide isomerase